MVLLVWRHVICKIGSQASSRQSDLESNLEEAPFGASRYGLSIAIAAFETFEEFDQGTYYSFETMAEEDRERLKDEYLSFSKGNKYREAGGLERDWPYGRGVFHNESRLLLIWVNFEDHISITAMANNVIMRALFLLLFFF